MPLSRAHKERSRQAIVDAAARLFRRHGFDGVGIDDIMAAAGLTRGGFYNHFRSKAALFEQVVAHKHGFIDLMRRRDGRTRTTLRAQCQAIVDDYLEPAHLTEVGEGCTMAALLGDVARAGPAARRGFSAAVARLADEFARGLDAGKTQDDRALASLALCVGGLALARGLSDRKLAAALLAACRAEVELLQNRPARPRARGR